MKNLLNRKARILSGLMLIGVGSAMITVLPAYASGKTCVKDPASTVVISTVQACKQQAPCDGPCIRKRISRVGHCEDSYFWRTCTDTVARYEQYRYETGTCDDKGMGAGEARCYCNYGPNSIPVPSGPVEPVQDCK